jgi:fructosamine-3-kinase
MMVAVRPDCYGRIAAAAGATVRRFHPLAGGCVGAVYRVELTDGRQVAVKLADPETGRLQVEGAMLDDLARLSRLPAPRNLYAAPELLVMSWIDNDGGAIGASVQSHAAELLAELHGITAERYGYDRDTLIGGLAQPNGQMTSWRAFFAERRLLYMAREAHRAGTLPSSLLARVESLAGRLDRWIAEDTQPSLIHGDMWSGNVLVKNGRVAGFVDPAIHYADAEIELAFATLFATFGDPFFRRYDQLRPLRPGFFEERRELYNLYPLLVHARLFGGGYVESVATTLSRYGC